MPDIPDRLIALTAAAIRRELHPGDVYTMVAGYDEKIARAALEAAAPAFAEEAAAAILRHMERSCDRRGSWRGLPAYRRHFTTAARIAAGAVATDEDLKRAAAEVLNRARRSRKTEEDTDE